MRRSLASLALLLAIGTAAAALPQDFIGGRREPMPEPGANQPYDGRLTFVRQRYNMGFGGRRWEPPWAHDYPTADVHMMKILNELTLARPRLDGSNVMSLADPDLHSYPIAYMSEPKGFTQRPCRGCGKTFAVNRANISCCSDICRMDVLSNDYGLDLDITARTPAERWSVRTGGREPLTIEPPILELLHPQLSQEQELA